MQVNLPKKFIVGSALVAIVGILLGAFFATRKDIGKINTDPVATVVASPGSQSNNFGTYFNSISLGRSSDGSAIKSDTPLVKSSKFYTGERAGMRVQTAAGLVSSVSTEVRFLKTDTGEETPSLQKMRQNITIKPGTRSYCCITMPKEAGSVSIQIVVKGQFLGSIGNYNILLPKSKSGGGLFAI